MEEEMGLKSAYIILDAQGPSGEGWKLPKDIQRALENALELSLQWQNAQHKQLQGGRVWAHSYVQFVAGCMHGLMVRPSITVEPRCSLTSQQLESRMTRKS